MMSGEPSEPASASASASSEASRAPGGPADARHSVSLTESKSTAPKPESFTDKISKGLQRLQKLTMTSREMEGFGIAKIWGLQKIGKAAPTQESEQFQLMLRAFHVNRQELSDLAEQS